jgi:EAL domain-containing protein (putative c-di-GMP-specific phosphodiesterase class I)
MTADTRTGAACKACRSPQPLFPFTMAFQPIIDLQNRRIDAYEALVRSPDGGAAASVLAQVNSENVYAFDQACCVKAIELVH